MRSEVRTNCVIVNEQGRISDSKGMNIKVHFDLTETQDFVDGIPGLKFGFGDVRYRSKHTPELVARVHSRARVNLKADGIERTVYMNSPVGFTVINDAMENRIRDRR